ncbi:hypothetical protein [Mesorhizobium sp.]|uniref:hypothetical protein n=1 Tax=Mesorhizobium sp. TaxID=1871066 RepID=UPI002579A30D|nr:hypothetical protein [Mesorhizobium sp.]
MARICTRLDPFSPEERGRLIYWGWFMTDLSVRSYILRDAPAPVSWPDPQWALD